MNDIAYLPKRSAWMVLAAKILIIAGWTALILFVARVFLPSPLPVGVAKTRNIYMILPEGWGYFTRNPREPILQVYSLDGREPVLVPNFSKRYLFGLRRDGRSLGGEIDIVASKVPRKAWLKAQRRISFDVLPDSTVVVRNTSHKATLCGDYLIQVQDRMPWAWARSRDSVVMPSKVAHVHVTSE